MPDNPVLPMSRCFCFEPEAHSSIDTSKARISWNSVGTQASNTKHFPVSRHSRLENVTKRLISIPISSPLAALRPLDLQVSSTESPLNEDGYLFKSQMRKRFIFHGVKADSYSLEGRNWTEPEFSNLGNWISHLRG